MSEIKRAIFIAAGEGKRMRPLTLECPKPLIEVNGESFIDRSIRILKEKGIREFYIVAGYKKEAFEEHFADDPEVHIINNPDYLKGNNITSMYRVTEFLPDSMVMEGDIMVENEDILNTVFDKSCYLATYMEKCPEWALKVKNGRIERCRIEGDDDSYRLWGISLWNEEDGKRLGSEIRAEFESGNWSVYWDEIALFRSLDKYDLGIREISPESICEIDTIEELAEKDSRYKEYVKQ